MADSSWRKRGEYPTSLAFILDLSVLLRRRGLLLIQTAAGVLRVKRVEADGWRVLGRQQEPHRQQSQTQPGACQRKTRVDDCRLPSLKYTYYHDNPAPLYTNGAVGEISHGSGDL